MKNFLLNSLFVLLVACSTKPLSTSAGDPEVIISSSTFKIPFSNGFKSFFFKAQSDIYGQYLSGLLIIKPVAEADYRVVFTTEVGIKLFDFEFAGDKFIVHYCMDKLNKKPVLKILEKDFRLLLMNGVPGIHALKKTEEAYHVYYWKDLENKESLYYYVNKESNQVEKIAAMSDKDKPKVHVLLTEYMNNFPNNIKIVHDNIKLKIELKFIER